MKVSQLFLDLRVHFECSGDIGKFLKAYQDTANIWTIGIGTTMYPDGTRVKEGDTCTEEQAYDYARHATAKLEASIMSTVPAGLLQHRFDSICDFAYNAGFGAWKSSTLRKVVSANPEDPTIEKEFLKWDKFRLHGTLTPSTGLQRRRKCEYYLYRNGHNHPTFFE